MSTLNSSEALYDRVAHRPTKKWNLQIRSLLFEKFYLPHLTRLGITNVPNGQFAEIGCGHGDKLARLTQILPTKTACVGIDESREMLKVARQKYPHLAFQQDDARELNTLKDHQLDGAFYFQVLHHLTQESLEKAFVAAKQKIKPGGNLVIIDSLEPERKIQNIVFRFVEREYSAASIHSEAYHNFSKETLLKIAEKNGFQLTFETGTKWPYIISEMLVFTKTEES